MPGPRSAKAPTVNDIRVQLLPCGSEQHRSDLAYFRDRNLPVPHNYSTWPLSSTRASWTWCRVLNDDNSLLAAYAIELTPSRALPGTQIGRVERLGRALHADAIVSIGRVLAETARVVPRMQRLDVHLFDEDARRRARYSDSLLAAGAVARDEMIGYDRTLVLELGKSDEDLLAAFSASTRRNVRQICKKTDFSIAPIREAIYVDRIRQLARSAFGRTGATPAALDVEAMLADSIRDEESALFGVFHVGQQPPDNLVAFAWGRLHGDYVVYEAGAVQRGGDLRRLSPGYALVWSLMIWAREKGATWFDLGGTFEADHGPEHPLHGISSFKRGFSIRERIVAREFTFGSNSILSGIARITRRAAEVLGVRH